MIYGQRPGIHYLKRPLNSGHTHFRGKILCACSAFPIQSRVPNLKSPAQAVLQICVRSYAENCRGHVTYATPTFRENYLCARAEFQIQSCIPNLKSLAQVVFEILRSKCIGVTSLTFQGHVTSSVTCPFDSPYAISYW